jgi:putative restriction endonuclease
MSIYVYPTDGRWFQFLAERQPLEEVNFWQPGGSRAFSGLQPGDLFLFRLKSPVNMIAGGGVFTHATLFPIIDVWEAFQERNGVDSYQQLENYIAHYRQRNAGEPLYPDSLIGCIILQAPFFLPPERWIAVPSDYHPNLVQGKSYGLDSASGKALFEWARKEIQIFGQATSVTAGIGAAHSAPMFKEGVIARQRLGQGTFRVLVSDAYSRRCAITGERTLPVLEAAHIRPVHDGGEHRIDNGLLLRSDIHKLFDLGYVSIAPTGEFRVSRQLKHGWQNGRVYYDLEGRAASLPQLTHLQPSQELLAWHHVRVFRQ